MGQKCDVEAHNDAVLGPKSCLVIHCYIKVLYSHRSLLLVGLTLSETLKKRAGNKMQPPYFELHFYLI